MSPSEHPISMPEQDARHRKALHKTVRYLKSVQNKTLCKRPVCRQIETEENESFSQSHTDQCNEMCRIIS